MTPSPSSGQDHRPRPRVPSGRAARISRLWLLSAVALLLAALPGCSHFRPKPKAEYVYVLAKQAYLRDRVAAVSNRTATVTNGQALQLLERGRHFLKVRTEKGEIGWVEERTVAPQDVEDVFAALKRDHAGDPTVATAVLRDELYMHAKPGRDTDRLYLLPEGEKLQLLQRTSVEKADPSKPAPKPVAKKTSSKDSTKSKAAKQTAPAVPAPVPAPVAASNSSTSAAPAEPPAPPLMEDWWLTRDSHGNTGWLLGRRMDVDVPDDLTKYSEGQHMVGAYVLATVHDPGVEPASGGANVNEYATVLSAPRDGLPYDFDQVRVYTWNLKMHRYETAYRQRDIEGFLPLVVHSAANGAPGFSIQVAAADSGAMVTDPQTGVSRPAHLIEQNFRMEGNVIRRVYPPGQTASQQPAVAHPEPLPNKKDKAAAGKKKRR